MVKHGISTSVPGDNIEKRAPTLRMCNKSPAALSSNRVDCGKPLGGMAVADEANGELAVNVTKHATICDRGRHELVAVGVVKRAGVVWSVVHTGSKVVGKHRISERLNDSGDRLSTSVVNKRGSVVVVGTAVVDTAALAGDEEIVVVVWVTVVVVEVSIDGAWAMTPVEMAGW